MSKRCRKKVDWSARVLSSFAYGSSAAAGLAAVDVRPVSGAGTATASLSIETRRRGGECEASLGGEEEEEERKKERKEERKEEEKKGAIANEIGRTHQQWMYSIHSASPFQQPSLFFLLSFGGTRFHFNTSLQKPVFNGKKPGLGRRTFTQSLPPTFKLIKINPIVCWIAHYINISSRVPSLLSGWHCKKWNI